MKVLPGIVLSGIVLSACSSEPLPPAGGPGVEPPTESLEAPLVGADDDHPCGAATLADVSTTNGNRLQLCAFSPGVEAFVETGPIGRASAVKTMAPTTHTSALEILPATT